jgi:hypothetical protein
MEKPFACWSAALCLLAATSVRAETKLESTLLTAVRDAHFADVVDFGAGNEERPVSGLKNSPAQKIAHPPNVNVAVLQLDGQGNLVDRACVILSRDYPAGLIVPLDKNLDTTNIRFLRWDIDRSNGGKFSSDGNRISTKGWTNNPPLTEADELVPGQTNAPYQFMAPYPASLFKSMVAFHVMRMIDASKLSLDSEYNFQPIGAKPDSRKIRVWLDAMITVSDNLATQALLKMFHDQNEIESLNREFRELNLPTLQINGTDPKNGRGWDTAKITLTAWDIARMFWLIDGGAKNFWNDANGQPITEKILSEDSRAFLKKILSEQGFNNGLTTANFPGTKNVPPGIPSRVADRWINPTNGHAIVDGDDFGVDIRAANAQAEVNFAHKTGWTFNYGADAGIVTSLPKKPFRHYIIAFVANLGQRYTDEIFAERKTFPDSDGVPIFYTQKIPALGKAVDDALVKLSAGKE